MQTNNKLREALVLALSLLDLKEGVPYKTVSQKDLDFIKTALAESARNCDVGTAEEQAKRYARHCDAYLRDDGGKPCTNCPCCGKIPYGRCEFAWAQLPYESEVAK